MFAVFKRKNLNEKFELIGYWDNDENDVWVKNTIEKLNLEIQNTRIVKFNKQEFKHATQFQANNDPCCNINYDDENDRIQLIHIDNQEETIREYIPYDSSKYDLSDYYSAESIQLYNTNIAFWKNSERDWELNPPTEEELNNYKLPEAEFFDVVINSSQNIEIVEEVQGIEIDILEIIANEEGV